MTGEMTDRLGLPLLVPGQAQKEMTHNEALTLLAIAVQPSVRSVGLNTPPTDPAPGDCWVVGPAPTGAWTGRAHAIAGWTIAGWRFVTPHSGFTVEIATNGCRATFREGTWRVDSDLMSIATPVGGDVVDTKARTAIVSLLSALRGRGLLAE